MSYPPQPITLMQQQEVPYPMDNPHPSILDNVQNWIGGIVAAGTGMYAIWKGVRFSANKAREVYRILSQFADALDVLTELNQRTAQIAATQEVYSAISPQPIWRSDVNGHCIRANAALLSLIGITFDDIKGTGWASYVHPEDRERVMSEWNDAIKSKSRFNAQFRFIRPDGGIVDVKSRAFPIVTADGAVIGFIGTDIANHGRQAYADH